VPDEILTQTLNMLEADTERSGRLAALAPLLADAGLAYVAQAITLLLLIHEIISRVEAQMPSFTAHLQA
jgi:hypothetical protein